MLEEAASESVQNASGISFPGGQPQNQKKSFPKWIFAIIGVILIVGIGGYFVFKTSGSDEAEQNTNEGTQLGTFSTPSPEPSQESSPTPSPEPIEKSDIKIEVLNGTGVPGEAGFLKTKLEAEDFQNIETGNAEDQDQTRTTVTFSRDLSQIYIDEVTKLLENLYEEVTAKKGTISEDFDIRIVTGVKKSSSSTSATKTASPSPTATPSE